MWKWAILAGLLGYLIIHPAVMISGHLMMETHAHQSIARVAIHEIKRSFALEMLPWSMAFTLGAAILGGLYGRLKGIEQVLRASRVRYQTVVDDQLDYICRFQPDGKCTFVNNSFCRLIYRSREDLLNHSLFEQAEFGDPSAWRAQVARLSPENTKTEIEQCLDLPDGATCWIRWIVIAILDEAGQITEYQSVGHDVTAVKQAQRLLESHQAELARQVRQRTRELNESKNLLLNELKERTKLEKELRESELRYRMLFDSAPMGIALSTVEGRVLAANQALLAMLKMDAGDLVSISAQDLYAIEKDRRRLLAQLREDRLVREAEVELKRLDGSRFYASLNLTWFENGGLDTILAVVNDITLRRQALNALKASEVELQQLSSQLLSVQEEERKRIARELHDSVGQLMHAMKYAVETAIGQLTGIDAAAEARSTLVRLMPILKDAAAENRRIVMDLRPSLLDDLGILATLNWFCREYGRVYGGITIEKTIQVEESEVPADLRIVVYRIVQEAFNNIAKHSRATRVRLTIANPSAGLVLTIEDDGVGLPREDGRREGRFAGGFGMSSMRERARTAGGRFELFAAAGGGTGIRVTWPAGQPKAQAVPKYGG